MSDLGEGELIAQPSPEHRRLFGEYVTRALRKEPVSEVATECGCTENWLTAVLAGDELPTEDLLGRISLRLGYEQDMLQLIWKTLGGPNARLVAEQLRDALDSTDQATELEVPQVAEVGDSALGRILAFAFDVRLTAFVVPNLYFFSIIAFPLVGRLGVYGQDNLISLLIVACVAWLLVSVPIDFLVRACLRRLRNSRRLGIRQEYENIDRAVELRTGLSPESRWDNARALLRTAKSRQVFTWHVARAEICERMLLLGVAAIPIQTGVLWSMREVWWLFVVAVVVLAPLLLLGCRDQLRVALRSYVASPTARA